MVTRLYAVCSLISRHWPLGLAQNGTHTFRNDRTRQYCRNRLWLSSTIFDIWRGHSRMLRSAHANASESDAGSRNIFLPQSPREHPLSVSCAEMASSATRLPPAADVVPMWRGSRPAGVAAPRSARPTAPTSCLGPGLPTPTAWGLVFCFALFEHCVSSDLRAHPTLLTFPTTSPRGLSPGLAWCSQSLPLSHLPGRPGSEAVTG